MQQKKLNIEKGNIKKQNKKNLMLVSNFKCMTLTNCIFFYSTYEN